MLLCFFSVRVGYASVLVIIIDVAIAMVVVSCFVTVLNVGSVIVPVIIILGFVIAILAVFVVCFCW